MATQASHIRIEHWPPLEGVTLELARFMVLLGRNDTGKTRALQAMAHILSPEPPGEEAPRCGGWVPTRQVEKLLRTRLDLPEGDLLVLPEDETQAARVRVGDEEIPLPQELAKELSRPVGDVVWLQVTDSDFARGAVRQFLHRVLGRLIESGWDPPGDPDAPEEDEHYVEAMAVERGVLTRPRAWVDSALGELARRAFKLLPAFVSIRFEAMDVSMHLELCETWTGEVSLRSREGAAGLEELSSGVRAWVNLAVVEAARELEQADVTVDEAGQVAFATKGSNEPVLYLIDEPERHLHPAAQVEAAMWLMDLVDSRPEVSVGVATHSPAFLDLPVGKASVQVCQRAPLTQRKRTATISTWSLEEVEAVHRLADCSGFRASDVFLGGTVPVLVEGKMDRDYLRTAWRILRKCSPEAEGVRLFVGGGVTQAEVIALDLLERLYPLGTPIVFLTDNLQLDRPGTQDAVDNLRRHCPNLVHLSHARFDTWALVPESVLAAVDFRGSGTWDQVEARRRGILKREPAVAHSSLPGKQDVLPDARGRVATEAFSRALAEIERRGAKAVHPSIPGLVRKLAELAGRGAS